MSKIDEAYRAANTSYGARSDVVREALDEQQAKIKQLQAFVDKACTEACMRCSCNRRVCVHCEIERIREAACE